MKFVCVQQCFFNENLYNVGDKLESDIDISKPSKEGENISWRKIDEGTQEAETGEKKTHIELMKMKCSDMVLYVNSRFKGTTLDPNLARHVMMKEIKLLESAKEKEDKQGFI